jgi:hypothetical protein
MWTNSRLPAVNGAHILCTPPQSTSKRTTGKTARAFERWLAGRLSYHTLRNLGCLRRKGVGKRWLASAAVRVADNPRARHAHTLALVCEPLTGHTSSFVEPFELSIECSLVLVGLAEYQRDSIETRWVWDTRTGGLDDLTPDWRGLVSQAEAT